MCRRSLCRAIRAGIPELEGGDQYGIVIEKTIMISIEWRNTVDVRNEKNEIAEDVEAVVTSFNQGDMLLEAVSSLQRQTTPPAKIIVVDDGSTDENSVRILRRLEADFSAAVPIEVIRQSNRGVSGARNAGIGKVQTPFALVLDGDDKLEPFYIERVSHLLREQSSVIAASSWMRAFGVLNTTICPGGGDLAAFCVRNCSPATHILRREVWERCGGYDESMRSGFEDWDFFLSILETKPDAYIGIVREPLLNYRTAPASSNIKSMSKRLELMRYLIEKHIDTYRKYVTETILGLEAISTARLCGWESEILHEISAEQILGEASDDLIRHPSYGDGGMAAAVRIESFRRAGEN